MPNFEAVVHMNKMKTKQNSIMKSGKEYTTKSNGNTEPFPWVAKCALRTLFCRTTVSGSEVAAMFKCICWKGGNAPEIKSCTQPFQQTVTCGSQDNYNGVTDQKRWMCWLMYLNMGAISKNYIKLNMWLVCTTAQMQSTVYTHKLLFLLIEPKVWQ